MELENVYLLIGILVSLWIIETLVKWGFKIKKYLKNR